MQKSEQMEYVEFWTKLAHKAQEIQEDFSNLTQANQVRIASDAQAIMQAGSLSEALHMIKRLAP